MQHDFILLDRSGSMDTLWEEAIGSVNGYVKKIAEDKVDTGVTLAVFDGEGGLSFDIVRDKIVPSTWKDVGIDEVTPRGLTPLNDAVGKVVNLAEAGGYDKVAIIIMTDGAENASRELTVQQAKDLLDKCRAKNWQVIFLGANFDNAKQAMSYGNIAANTVRSSVRNMRNSMRATASMRAGYGATGQAIQFTDEQKEELAKD